MKNHKRHAPCALQVHFCSISNTTLYHVFLLRHTFLWAFVDQLSGFGFENHLMIHQIVFLFVSGASHGLLDTLTNGGLGIALLWPFSDERYFAPAQVIQVSPINPARFFSKRAVDVLLSEGRWVWLPCVMLFLSLVLLRCRNSLRKS